MAKSKFDESLLEPLDNESSGFDSSLLEPDEEMQFNAPKKESIGSWLPRDIMIGLLSQRQNLINTPHDIAKNLEGQGRSFEESINKTLPLEQYIGSNKLPFSSNEKRKSISEYLPHEQNDFSKLMGQEGTPSDISWLIQKGIEHAPELYGIATLAKKLPAVTSKGIINKLSGHKKEAKELAQSEYGQLFKEASDEGITHVIPPEAVSKNRHRIIANSQGKYNKSLKEYLQNPTLENAHWAQSELGGLERHLNSIGEKNGLSPSQHKTLKAVEEARRSLKEEMFSKNVLGSNEQLGKKYSELSDKYRKNVIPYTRLEALTEAESNRLKPKNAVDQLLKDDQFMIELSKRYPGLFLHTPKAKKLKSTALGTGVAIGGWEGLKRFLK